MSNVLIEFTEATDKRARGERVWVDEKSAVSLVDKKKVAARVTEDAPAAADAPAAPGRPAKAPAPAPAGGE